GILDYKVTGVQTCALPICNLPRPSEVPYTVNTVAASVTGREADFTGEDFGAMFEQALKSGQYEARLAACRARNAAGGDVRFGIELGRASWRERDRVRVAGR